MTDTIVPIKPRIYIAGKFFARNRLRVVKRQLEQLGYDVLSEWIDPQPLDDSLGGDYDSIGTHLEDSQKIAARDEQEVRLADVFIIDTQDESATGGREVEFGMATILECELYRVGPIRNVFHSRVPADHCFQNWTDLVKSLEEYYG